jgi:D-lactate dehydrogenase
MQVALFSVRKYEQEAFERANVHRHDLRFIEERLSVATAEAANGCRAVCCFTSDHVDEPVLTKLSALGVKLICLRSAGFNHVDLKAAVKLNLPVVRVPDYSPYAVAEHATGLLLCLNRKLHRAFNRVRELNFSLEGLVGFDLHGKTAGVIGAGNIGAVFAKIMHGFGMKILIHDQKTDSELARFASYVELEELLAKSDVVSLHVPLTPETHHMIDAGRLALMRPGAILINTGRGGLIDTRALIQALKAKTLGGACLDVYEEEDGVFFSDFSSRGIDDDMLARLLTFPNVLITAHQGFLTHEALDKIAETTLSNISRFELGQSLLHRVDIKK